MFPLATTATLARQTGSRAPLLAVAGDSVWDATASQDTATLTARFIYGPMTWLLMLTHQRVQLATSWDFAVAGDTSTLLRNRIDAVCASDADIVVVNIGTNDVNSGVTTTTFSTFVSNMEVIYRALLDAGKIVIACPPYGRSLSTPANDAAWRVVRRMQQWVQSRQWLGQRNFYVVDPNALWVAPLSTTGAPKTYYDYDGLHPRGLGSYYLAKPVATLINTLYPVPADNQMFSVRDVYDATDLPTGNLLPNGICDGAATNAGSGGPTFAGTNNWATSLTIAGVAGSGGTITGVTVTGSKTTLANGLPAQQVAITSSGGTQTGSGTGSAITITMAVASPGTKIAAGDIIEALASIEWDGVSQENIACIRYRLRVTDGGTTRDATDGYDTVADLLPSVADTWTMRTPAITLNNAPTLCQVTIWVSFRNQSSVNFVGTLRFGGLVIRKVIA